MNQFSFYKGKSPELQAFPHIMEFFCKKIQHVQPDSFALKESLCLRFYFVLDGKFEWQIDNHIATLYPNDAILVFPKQIFGSPKGVWDVGMVVSIMLNIHLFSEEGELVLGEWSNIPVSEQRLIGKMFSLNKKPIMQNFKLIAHHALPVLIKLQVLKHYMIVLCPELTNFLLNSNNVVIQLFPD